MESLINGRDGMSASEGNTEGDTGVALGRHPGVLRHCIFYYGSNAAVLTLLLIAGQFWTAAGNLG